MPGYPDGHVEPGAGESQPSFPKLAKSRGAPKKPEAEKTRVHWAQIGKPTLTAEVCDALAEHTYPDEYAKAARYSQARKKLRDRVAQQVRSLLKKKTPAK